MDTTILIKRSQTLGTAANVQLQYGEPLYTDDQYITVGNENESLVSQRNVIRLVPKSQADSQLYYTVNSSGKVVINILNGTTLTPVLTFGSASQRDVADSAVADSTDVITSGAVKSIQTQLENSISDISTDLEDLEDNISDLVGKSLDTTVTPNSENPITAGAVYTFVNQVVTEAFNNYRPWTTDPTDTKKFYLNSTTGMQYRSGNNRWVTVPVGYT